MLLAVALVGCGSASDDTTTSSAPAAGSDTSPDALLRAVAAEFEASPVSNAGSALAVSERDQIRFLLDRMEAEDALGSDVADRVVAAFDELRARQAAAEAARRDAQASRLTLPTRRAVDPAAETRMGSDWSMGFSSGVVELAGRLLTEPGGSASDSFETSWEANGTKAKLKASFSLAASGGGGTARVTGKATVTVTLVAPDGSVTSLVATVNAEGTLGACPDEDGVVRGELTFTGTAELTGKTPASATLTIHAVARGIVGDDAFLQSAELRQDGEIQAVVPVLGVSGSAALSGSYEFPAGPGGTIDIKQMRNGFQAGYKVSFEETSYAMPAEFAVHVMAYPAIMMSFLALEAIADASQKAWRGGTCLEIRTGGEEGGEVDAGVTIPFMATLWHKIEGREVARPLTVSFDGVASLTPTGGPHDPPVLVTYIAGAEPGETGTARLQSVSNRGIAEKRLSWRVRDRNKWHLTMTLKAIGGTDVQTRVVWEADLAIKRDGTITGSGSGTVGGADGQDTCDYEADGKSVHLKGGTTRGSWTFALTGTRVGSEMLLSNLGRGFTLSSTFSDTPCRFAWAFLVDLLEKMIVSGWAAPRTPMRLPLEEGQRTVSMQIDPIEYLGFDNVPIGPIGLSVTLEPRE